MYIFFSNVLIDINKMHNCNCAWSPSTKAEFNNSLIDLQLQNVTFISSMLKNMPGYQYAHNDFPRTILVHIIG